ncbi:FG-GAP repeat domain-containing protein, partial [Streptomyces sp. NPDC059956]
MRKQRFLALPTAAAATIIGATALTPAVAAPTAGQAATPAFHNTADFNGDGYPDLAVSADTAAVGEVDRAGMISVQYGSATGLRDKAALISRDTAGVPGEPARDQPFGRISGQGDVDHDGYTDLLVRDTQGLLMLRGGKDGLTGRDSGQIKHGSRTPDGSYLSPDKAAVGDVTGDGVPDILTTASENGFDHKLAVFQGPFNFATDKPAAVQIRHVNKLDDLRVMALFVADMTGDGIADVVATGFYGGVVYKGGP